MPAARQAPYCPCARYLASVAAFAGRHRGLVGAVPLDGGGKAGGEALTRAVGLHDGLDEALRTRPRSWPEAAWCPWKASYSEPSESTFARSEATNP